MFKLRSHQGYPIRMIKYNKGRSIVGGRGDGEGKEGLDLLEGSFNPRWRRLMINKINYKGREKRQTPVDTVAAWPAINGDRQRDPKRSTKRSKSAWPDRVSDGQLQSLSLRSHRREEEEDEEEEAAAAMWPQNNATIVTLPAMHTLINKLLYFLCRFDVNSLTETPTSRGFCSSLHSSTQISCYKSSCSTFTSSTISFYLFKAFKQRLINKHIKTTHEIL